MRKKVWYAPHKFESYGEEEIKAVNKALKVGWQDLVLILLNLKPK